MFVRIRWAAALAIILAFLIIFFAWPVGAMLLRGITDDAGALDVSAFGDVLATGRTWAIVGHTLTMALLGTGGAVLFGIPAAYILYRTDFPGRTLLRSITLVPFVLPTVVVGVAFRSLLGVNGPLGFLGLDQTTGAVVAAMVFFNISLIARQVGGLWQMLDPRTVEAARSLSRTGLSLLFNGIFTGPYPGYTRCRHTRNRSLPPNPNLPRSAHRRGLFSAASILCAGLGVVDPAPLPPHHNCAAYAPAAAPKTVARRLVTAIDHSLCGGCCHLVAHGDPGRAFVGHRYRVRSAQLPVIGDFVGQWLRRRCHRRSGARTFGQNCLGCDHHLSGHCHPHFTHHHPPDQQSGPSPRPTATGHIYYDAHGHLIGHHRLRIPGLHPRLEPRSGPIRGVGPISSSCRSSAVGGAESDSRLGRG